MENKMLGRRSPKGLDAARVTAKDEASSPVGGNEHPCAPAHQFAGVDRVPEPLSAVANGDPIPWQFSCCLFSTQRSKRSEMSVPEWLEPVSTLSSEPQWTFWILLAFLHSVEALCKKRRLSDLCSCWKVLHLGINLRECLLKLFDIDFCILAICTLEQLCNVPQFVLLQVELYLRVPLADIFHHTIELFLVQCPCLLLVCFTEYCSYIFLFFVFNNNNRLNSAI